MSLNNAEKTLNQLESHIRVCDSHDINSCIECIQLIHGFLEYVDNLNINYQRLSSQNKKYYRNLVKRRDDLSMIKKDKEKIVNDHQIKKYRSEFIKAFNIQWNIITKKERKYPKQVEDDMIYKYHAKPTLERLRQEEWFPNWGKFINYLEILEAQIISKDIPNAIKTPLELHDPRLPMKSENFYKYGKRVLKTLKELHTHIPTIFIEVLSYLSSSHTKLSEVNSITDYQIRFYNLRHNKSIPVDVSQQIKEDIPIYITNLNKLKLKLLLLSDRGDSLYKKFTTAPALSLRGGKKSKKSKKNKKRSIKKSNKRKRICI